MFLVTGFSEEKWHGRKRGDVLPPKSGEREDRHRKGGKIQRERERKGEREAVRKQINNKAVDFITLLIFAALRPSRVPPPFPRPCVLLCYVEQY